MSAELLFAMSHGGKCALAYRATEELLAYQVVTIEAFGLVHQGMSKQTFLREFNRDLLMEEWTALCKFLKIALAKSQNEEAALNTLKKGIEMKLSELKSKTMEELVEMHNTMAEAAGKKTVTKFKSLEAGRIAVVEISKASAPKKAAAKKPSGAGVEGRPRSGVGARAKDLIREGLGNKEVLEAIKAEFPDNSTTVSCIAYYRNALVKAGEIEGGRRKKEAAEEAPAPEVKKGKGKKAAAGAEA